MTTVGGRGYRVQMRDLYHARGSASGHYNDCGGKSGGDEERGRERDRYNEGDRNTGWQSDAHSARDRDRDRGSDRERKTEKRTEPRTGSGIAGIGTAKEIEMEGVSAAATATETETGIVAGQALSATNRL